MVGVPPHGGKKYLLLDSVTLFEGIEDLECDLEGKKSAGLELLRLLLV